MLIVHSNFHPLPGAPALSTVPHHQFCALLRLLSARSRTPPTFLIPSPTGSSTCSSPNVATTTVALHLRARDLALRSVTTTCQTCVSLTTHLYLPAHHHGNYNWHYAYVSMHYGAALTVTTCPAPPPAITVISTRVSPAAPSLTTAPA